MSNSKRKIAGALMLGATLTGTIGSNVTSAGLFDWFRGKEYRTKKNMKKQTNGYDAAISVAKKIYELDKDEKSKSVLEILEDLFFEKVEKNKDLSKLYTNYLNTKIDKFLDAANNKGIAKEEFLNILSALTTHNENYQIIKRFEGGNLKKLTDILMVNGNGNGNKIEIGNLAFNGGKKENNDGPILTLAPTTDVISRLGDEYIQLTSNYTVKGNNFSAKILAKDILSLKKIVDNICNSLSESIKDQENKDDPIAECIEELISTVKNNKINNIASGNGQDIGISYEDIINKLISKKMEGNENFGKIFEPAESDSNKIEKKDLAAILHELGYDEDMSFLPSWEKKSLGRLGRLAVVPVATTALSLVAAQILPFAGIASLLCQALICRTTSNLFNVVRHKEWSSFNPDNWEVKKFVKNVVMDFAFYGVFKFFGW